MFLKRIIFAGLCLFVSITGWADSADLTTNPPLASKFSLTISDTSVPKPLPELQAFIRQVWAENPAILGAQSAFKAAQARLDGAKKPLNNPTLSLDAERTDINLTAIGLSQTLDWNDKRSAFTGIAKRELQTAQAAVLEVRQRVAVEALGALAGYFTADAMLNLAQRRSVLMQSFVETVQQRQKAGDVAPLEVMLAQVAYSEALMQQAANASDLAESEAQLQAVSGLSQTHWPTLPNILRAPPQRRNEPNGMALAGRSSDAWLEALPALKVLRHRMAVAKAKITLAEREGQADPTLGVRAGSEDAGLLLGVSLEIPLFIRNNFSAQVREASHHAVEEELVYLEAKRRAKAHLDGRLSRFQNTARAWKTWLISGQQASQEQRRLLERMWSAGELTATEYLIQAKQNIDTQAAATALMGEVWQAAMAWLGASGQVEQWLNIVPLTHKNTSY